MDNSDPKRKVNPVQLMIGIALLVVGTELIGPAGFFLGLILIVSSFPSKKGERSSSNASQRRPPMPPPQPRVSGSSGAGAGSSRFLTPPRTDAPSNFNASSQDHQHITSSWLNRDRQMEQLKTMLEAGLIEKDEYQERVRRLEQQRRGQS